MGMTKEESKNFHQKKRAIREVNYTAYKILEENRLRTQARITSYFEGTLGRHDAIDPVTFNKLLMPNAIVSTSIRREEKKISVGTITAEDRIPIFISGLHEMVKSFRVTVEDAALLNPVSYEFIHDRILLKIPVDGGEGTRHEYMIGYHIMNSLRSVIPNFMLTYGMFDCGIPDTQSIGLCDPRAPSVSYLVVEKVVSAITARKFVETASYKDVCMLYLQVLLALGVAREKCGFAHYDLHGENVLLQPLMNAPYKQSYTFEDVKYDLALTHLAIIIDYGFAIGSKTVDGQLLKIAPETTVGITKNYETPNIVADIYRFFMDTQRHCPHQRKFQWMYDFFMPRGSGSHPLGKAVKDQLDNYYYYPYLGENVVPLIGMLVEVCSKAFDGTDISRGRVITSDMQHQLALPTNVFEYYERYEEFSSVPLSGPYIEILLLRAIEVCDIAAASQKRLNSSRRYYNVRNYISWMKFFIFCYEKNLELVKSTQQYAKLEAFYHKSLDTVQRIMEEDETFDEQKGEIANLFSDIGRANGGRDEEEEYQNFLEGKTAAEFTSLRYRGQYITE